MKYKILISFITLLFISGCSDDDDSTEKGPIIGLWTLVNTTGTIAGINHQFVENEIIWTFNTNNTVTVVNNSTDENLQSGFPSGTYPYTIADNENIASCPQNITIQTAEFGCLSFYGNEMDINENIADGINYHFYKIIVPD